MEALRNNQACSACGRLIPKVFALPLKTNGTHYYCCYRCLVWSESHKKVDIQLLKETMELLEK